MSLPCREAEFQAILQIILSSIQEDCGNCVYISGVPGTGKTATIRAIVSTLRQAVANQELDPFNFVEINGMLLANTDSQSAYSMLHRAIFPSGPKCSPAKALAKLEVLFRAGSKNAKYTIVLLDELDYLVASRKQAVVYNFFEWPHLPASKLIVLAVANTMDLPERALANKIASRLGTTTRIQFAPYSHQQLVQVVKHCLGEGAQRFSANAIELIARKVGAISGDARRVVEIAKRALDLQPEAGHTISLSLVQRALCEVFGGGGGLCSSIAIGTLPLVQRVFLGLLWAEQQRTGVAEQELGVVVAALAQLCRVHSVWRASVGAVAEIVGQLGRQKLIFCTGMMLGPRCLLTLGCGFGEAELKGALQHTVFKGVVS